MKKFLTAAIALSVLATAGAASAQPYQGRGDRGQGYEQGYERDGARDGRGDRRADRADRRDDRADRRDDRRDDRYERRDDRYERQDDRRYNRYERRAERRYNAGRYHAPRGYQVRNWHRGERLPAHYRGRGYVVDYRAYRLAPPPRGYQYTRVGDDVILTAIASGIIASVLVGMFH